MNYTFDQVIEVYRKQLEIPPAEQRIGLFSAADYNANIKGKLVDWEVY